VKRRVLGRSGGVSGGAAGRPSGALWLATPRQKSGRTGREVRPSDTGGGWSASGVEPAPRGVLKGGGAREGAGSASWEGLISDGGDAWVHT